MIFILNKDKRTEFHAYTAGYLFSPGLEPKSKSLHLLRQKRLKFLRK